jgi:hypothetical protein
MAAARRMGVRAKAEGETDDQVVDAEAKAVTRSLEVSTMLLIRPLGESIDAGKPK